jgi:rod shape-determining protein MreC
MRNLISFILKHYFFILFLLFEAVSFFLVYQTSYYQRGSMISSSNRVTGMLNDFYTSATGYFRLSKENEALAYENSVLRSLVPADTVVYPPYDSALRDTAYRYISAKVISNSINKRNNYFSINKGSNHGITIDMGVISTRGVAGIITGVSDNFATGMSLLHKDSRISGKIKKNAQLINVIWEGGDYRTGKVIDIPTHLELFPGDTIVTSGNSFIFPEGLMIGTIKEYYVNRDQLFNTADLTFSTDFNNLYYVHVIENLNLEELDKLQEIENE